MPKTFSVPVLDDGQVNSDHTVNLTLSAPTGGATLGAPSAAVLTVANADSHHHGGALGLPVLPVLLGLLGFAGLRRGASRRPF